MSGTGCAGLADRSSRPHRSPLRTPALLEQQILNLRTQRKLGPARIGGILGVPAATVHRVLVRHGVNRLSWMDRPTGRVVRRITTSRCGELMHIDVKKLAVSPMAGGPTALTAGPPARGQSLPDDRFPARIAERRSRRIEASSGLQGRRRPKRVDAVIGRQELEVEHLPRVDKGRDDRVEPFHELAVDIGDVAQLPGCDDVADAPDANRGADQIDAFLASRRHKGVTA